LMMPSSSAAGSNAAVSPAISNRRRRLHLVRVDEALPRRPSSLPGAPCSTCTRDARRWSPRLPSPRAASSPRRTHLVRARMVGQRGRHVDPLAPPVILSS
jgi:hypothetical protein